MTDHVLCAVDLTHPEAEAKILRRAADLASFYGATLSVVSVIPDYGTGFVASFFEQGTMQKAIDAANDQLHRFVKDVVPEVEKVQHLLEVGSVYEMVLDAAERSHADLIVMGAHRPTLADRVQGPNSARVARHAKCTVMVVRD